MGTRMNGWEQTSHLSIYGTRNGDRPPIFQFMEVCPHSPRSNHMMRSRSNRIVLASGVLAVVIAMVHTLIAQTPAPAAAPATTGTTFDETVPPGANFDKADFRLWLPNDVAAFQGVIVLVPGSNGDGRPEAADAAWQSFAAKHKFALVGVHLNDKQHDQGFIEEYANVSKGSGQAKIGRAHV